MKVEQITVISSNNMSHAVCFWKIGEKLAARPMSDDQKVNGYRTFKGDNYTVSRHFNYGCEIVKFKFPITSYITSEAPKVVIEYKDFLEKSNKMFVKFGDIVNEHIQELESLSKSEETGERVYDS